MGINASLRLSSPRFCKGFGRLSALSQIPSTEIWAFASALERSQEFLEAVGRVSEASGGFLGGFMGAPGELLGSSLDRSGASGAAAGGMRDVPGRPGKAQTLRL